VWISAEGVRVGLLDRRSSVAIPLGILIGLVTGPVEAIFSPFVHLP